MSATADASLCGDSTRRLDRPLRAGGTAGCRLDPAPVPPARDVLRWGVELEAPPVYQLPRETLALRVGTALGNLGLASWENDVHLYWRVQTATAVLMASVCPEVRRELETSGWMERHGAVGKFTVGPVTHPYDLMGVARILIDLPESLNREKRFLETLTAAVLGQYVKEISKTYLIDFTLENEARNYFLRGSRLEQIYRGAPEADDSGELLQEVYDCFYHARYYYMFSVIGREISEKDGKPFGMYCHAAHTAARIVRESGLRDPSPSRRLPSHREVVYLARHDQAVQNRCAIDPDLVRQVKALISTFPS